MRDEVPAVISKPRRLRSKLRRIADSTSAAHSIGSVISETPATEAARPMPGKQYLAHKGAPPLSVNLAR